MIIILLNIKIALYFMPDFIIKDPRKGMGCRMQWNARQLKNVLQLRGWRRTGLKLRATTTVMV